MANHTPEPWDIDTSKDGDGIRSYSLVDASGKTIVDTFNSGVAEIHVEHGEFGTDRWDEQGCIDTLRIQRCVNACKGIENPAAIKDLLEACRSLVFWDTDEHTTKVELRDAVNKAVKALAKLKEHHEPV